MVGELVESELVRSRRRGHEGVDEHDRHGHHEQVDQDGPHRAAH